jgi:hypothetical protein
VVTRCYADGTSTETPQQFSQRIWRAYHSALSATGGSMDNLGPLNRVLSEAKSRGMTMIEALEYIGERSVSVM